MRILRQAPVCRFYSATAVNGDNPAAQAILEAMKQVIEGMKSMNQNPEIRQQLESTLDE